MAKKLTRSPLSEVVFEMRWENIQSQFGFPFDPGYPLVVDALTEHAGKVGLGGITDIVQPPYAGLSGNVSRRLHSQTTNFPILQIGHGVFAANDSHDYEWEHFAAFATDAAKVVVAAYPRLREYKLQITHLELRYVNIFDSSLVGTIDFVDFLSAATNVGLLLPMLGKEPIRNGRVVVEYPTKKLAGLASEYVVDAKSVVRDGAPFIALEHKVISRGTALIVPRTQKSFHATVQKWMTGAHEIASPGFRALLNEDTLARLA